MDVSNCIWPPARDERSGVVIGQVGRGHLIGQVRMPVRTRNCKARKLLTCAREAIDITRVSKSHRAFSSAICLNNKPLTIRLGDYSDEL